MKKILFIIITISLTLTTWLNAQDVTPLPSLTIKKLISPNNPVYYYNTADSAFWVFKGETGWLRLAANYQLQKYYVPYDNAWKNVHLGDNTIKSISFILDTTYVHTGLEEKGTLAWDSATQSMETHIADDLHLNNGEELWVPLCYNNSGSTILNGQPVYIDDAYGNSPTIMLASNITYDESRLIGVATQDIPTSSYGRVTRFGYVNDINLSSCSPGNNVYLGDKVLTHTRPTGGLFPVVIGKAITCSTNGRLLVYPQSVEYTSEVNRADGWVSYLQGDQTNLSFSNASRILTITPTASTFYFYQSGVKYIKTGAQSFQITDVEGIHLVYYDLGVLYESVNPSSDQTLNIIRNSVMISVVYWDFTNKASIYVSNERHTFHWPSWVHAYAHISFGTQYQSGLGITNITLGTGSSNADARFGVDSGSISDEDIITTTSAVPSTAGIPIYYRLGAGLGTWRRVVRAGYVFLNDPTTTLAMYNLYSGGTWSIASMTNNYYRLVHVFATNDISVANGVIAMSGVAQYSSAAAAELAAAAEIANIYNSNLPFAEVKHIGSLILHSKTGLGNSVNARYVAIPSQPTGSNYYMDFRKSTPLGTGGGGSGATSFLGLSDTPTSYAGQTNKIVGVSSGETGVEFKAATATSAGTINIPTGQQYQINGGSIIVDAINDGVTTTASSQNAIYDALALKAPISGSGNYIQNQNASAQSATMWITGVIKTDTLVGTGTRIVTTDSDGILGAADNGIGALINDGSGNISYWNYNTQSLSGTTPTWNVVNGLNAIITLSGNTAITLTNLAVGMTGKISITNPATAYKIKFVGVTAEIKGVNLAIDSNGITFSGSSKYDTMTWTWNGTILEVHVNKEYTVITW